MAKIAHGLQLRRGTRRPLSGISLVNSRTISFYKAKPVVSMKCNEVVWWTRIKSIPLHQRCFIDSDERFFMGIKEYRLTSMEEPSDEILHELMEQVADSARKSSDNARRVLQEKLQETIAEIRRQKSMSSTVEQEA